MLQGAGFTGAATGVNLARDIEQGWFDRLLVSPAPRSVLLAGLVLSASLRSLIPATFLLAVGFALGVDWPGLDGLADRPPRSSWAMAAVAACWGTSLALRFRTQSAAPLMQAGMLRRSILTTTAYAPLGLLSGWLHTVAKYNPVTQVVEAARQGFVGGVTWGDTWPGLARARRARSPCSARSPCAGCAARPCDRARRARRGARRRSPSGCCGGTGPRASATASATPTRGRARRATRGSGTGTRASRRSSGGASTRARSRAELESLLAAQRPGRLHRPHDLLGPPGLARPRLLFYNVASRSRVR